MEMEKRVKELEKRIAALEVSVQGQSAETRIQDLKSEIGSLNKLLVISIAVFGISATANLLVFIRTIH